MKKVMKGGWSGLKSGGKFVAHGAKAAGSKVKKSFSGSSSKGNESRKNGGASQPQQPQNPYANPNFAPQGSGVTTGDPSLDQQIEQGAAISPSTMQQGPSSGGYSSGTQPFAQQTRSGGYQGGSGVQAQQSRTGGYSGGTNIQTQPFAQPPQSVGHAGSSNTQPFARQQPHGAYQGGSTLPRPSSEGLTNNGIPNENPVASSSLTRPSTSQSQTTYMNPYASNPAPPRAHVSTQPYATSPAPVAVQSPPAMFNTTNSVSSNNGAHVVTQNDRFSEVRTLVKNKARAGNIKDANYRSKFKNVSNEASLRSALISHFKRYIKDAKKPHHAKHHEKDKAQSIISYIEGNPSMQEINTRLLNMALSYTGNKNGSFWDRLLYAIHKTEQFLAPTMTSNGLTRN